MKLGWKGFNADLKCRGEQFEIGITYKKDKAGVIPILCSGDGWHYCHDACSVLSFYNAYRDRYCLIEILGDFTQDSSKGITNSFRIIKEVDNNLFRCRDWKSLEAIALEEADMYGVNKALRDEKEQNIIKDRKIAAWKAKLKEEIKNELFNEQMAEEAKLDELYEKALHLDVVAEIMTQYPTSIIGGSVALFLHGNRLKRWLDDESDVDIILPYFVPVNSVGNRQVVQMEEEETFSGQSFAEKFYIQTEGRPLKIEMLIDPKEPWEMIEYKGKQYRVNRLENIWKAKLSYNKIKHNKDLSEATARNKPIPVLTSAKQESVIDDLPF